MGARAALAFAAKREGTASMPASRWAHVLSLELGWMSPKEAKRYIEACFAASLLEEDGDGLRLTFEEGAVEIPRRFRPDPEDLPEPASAMKEAPAGPGSGGAAPDGFEAWAKRLAEHRGRDLADVLDDVAALQERMGGLLHAETAVLRLMAEAGLDVRAEAEAELERITRQGGAPGSAG